MSATPRQPHRVPRRGLFGMLAAGLGIQTALAIPNISSGHWIVAAAVALLAVVAFRGRACAAAMFLACALLFAAWTTRRTHEALPMPLERALGAALGGDGPVADPTVNALVRVRAEVVRPPRRAEPPRGALAEFSERPPSSVMDVRVRAVVGPDGDVPVSGRLWVRIGGEQVPAIRAGDQVVMTGAWSAVAPSLNPGGRDRRLWAAQDGRAGWLFVPGPSLVTVESVDGGWGAARAWVRRGLEGVRERARDVLDGSGRGAALTRAMLLGEVEADVRETEQAFMRLGLAHVLAISGFHLTVLAGAALLAIRLTGDRGRLESLAVGALVAMYLLVVPAEAPVIRAGVMVLVLLLSRAAGRRYDDLNILAWVGVGLLIWRPLDLLALGFQLSIGLTAALIWLLPRVERKVLRWEGDWIGPPPPLVRARLWVLRPVIAAAVCWLIATPAIVASTGWLSLAGIPATVLVGPFAVLVLAGGYAALMLGMFVPGAEAPAQVVIGVLGEWLAAFVHLLDAVPGTVHHLPRISVAWSVVATGALVVWLAWGRWRDWRWALLPVAMAAWLLMELLLGSRLSRDVDLRLDALAVGEGTCILVRSGDEAMLWDCGGGWPGAGVREIPRAVRALGAKRVRTVVITHPNFDHYCALLDVVEPLGVRRVYLNERFVQVAEARKEGPEAATLAGLASAGVEVAVLVAGDGFAFGRVRADVLSPERGWRPRSINDSSLIVRLTTEGGRSALLTGDAQTESLARLEVQHPELKAEVLELPHHGSTIEPARELVTRLQPRAVLQSAGDRRPEDAFWVSAARGRTWLLTARDGASWVELLRDGGLREGSFLKRGSAAP